jgi:hypothetical protein
LHYRERGWFQSARRVSNKSARGVRKAPSRARRGRWCVILAGRLLDSGIAEREAETTETTEHRPGGRGGFPREPATI